MAEAWITVVKTAPFLADAAAIMTEAERMLVVSMIARNPECGDLIRETGGVRKVRSPLAGRGKSGGARVIYYFLNAGAPVYLLAVFAKNEKANLSAAERKTLLKFVETLKKSRR